MAYVLLDRISLFDVIVIKDLLRTERGGHYNIIKECSGGFSIKIDDLRLILEKADQYCTSLSILAETRFELGRASENLKNRHDTRINRQGINSLPQDILLKIFQLVQRPLLLSCICRNFRDIAFNSPILWTRICSYMPPAIVNLYLDRSGPLIPLAVAFGPVTSRNFIDIIVPHLDRWSRADIFAYKGEGGLQHLIQAIRDRQITKGTAGELCLPKLSQLNFSVNMLLDGEVFEVLDKTTITKVSFVSHREAPVNFVVQHVNLFPNIQELSLDLVDYRFPTNTGDNLATENACYGVKKLMVIVHEVSLDYLDDLFRRMDTPNAQSMTIKISYSYLRRQTGISLPQSFLTKVGSYQYLREFNFISTRHCNQIDLILFITDLLRYCEHLEHLYIQARCKLSQYSDTSELLHKRPWDARQPLHSVELDNCSGLRSRDVETLGDLLRSGCSKFKILKITRCNLLDETFLGTLEQHMSGKLHWTIARIGIVDADSGRLARDPSDEWANCETEAEEFYRWKFRHSRRV